MKARRAEGAPRLLGSRRTKGAPRRGTCEAPPIRHGLRRDTFPSGEGGFAPFRGYARSGGAPLRSPRFAHACALRHRGKRRRPPAEADGGYSCSSGHAPLRRAAPFPTCPSTPAGKPRHARQAHQPAHSEGGPPVPPGRQRTTGITPQAPSSRPREEGISLAQHEAPPPKPSDEGSGGSHGAVSVWLPPVALWFFPASGKERPAHRPMRKGTPHPARRKEYLAHPRMCKGTFIPQEIGGLCPRNGPRRSSPQSLSPPSCLRLSSATFSSTCRLCSGYQNHNTAASSAKPIPGASVAMPKMPSRTAAVCPPIAPGT